jgi:hypothetical protein
VFVPTSRGAARVVELVDAPGFARSAGGEKSPCGFESRPGQSVPAMDEQLPNKRLKLPGGDRFKGSGVLCAGAHEPSFNDTARGGRVARSLSATR